jgi:transcriptional regulator with XRE-family HTH domain
MTDLDASQLGTRTSTATDVRMPEASETVVTARLLVFETAGLRDETRFLHHDTRELHRRALLHNLDVRTGPKAKLATNNLLAELAARGFAWNAVARLVGVSVPALRKWRQGETASGENRRKLAELAALCDLLEDEYHVEDVASWMEVPISSEAPVRPLELYERGRTELLLDWAAHRVDPYSLLDEAFPGWHERYRSEFEVFRADDGLALRLRDR